MRHFLLIIAAMCSYVGFASQLPEQLPDPANPQKEQARIAAHVAREKAREARTADFVKHIDSMILTHSYTFIPTTFQRQPAGMPRMIVNPNFRLGIYPDFMDIYLPYIKGITPPYYLSIINYTIVNPQGYLAIQTNEGWTISFKTSLFSVNTYTFTFNIYATTGEAVLNISSDLYNTVTYNGSIIGHY